MPFQSLRRRILQSTNKSRNRIILRYNHLRQPIIRQFNMPLIGNKYILRLQLSIYNPFRMQYLNPHNNLCHNPSYNLFCKNTLFSLKIIVDITTRHILHYNVDFVLVLESLANGWEKRILTYFTDTFRLEHIELFYFSLVDDLHRVLMIILFVLREDDISESSSSKIFYRLVILCTTFCLRKRAGL